MADPVTKIITEFEDRLKKYPHIPMGTPDPYTSPANKGLQATANSLRSCLAPAIGGA